MTGKKKILVAGFFGNGRIYLLYFDGIFRISYLILNVRNQRTRYVINYETVSIVHNPIIIHSLTNFKALL